MNSLAKFGAAMFAVASSALLAAPVVRAEERAAPELVGINHWLNSRPVSLSSLRGKVVLVNFWTYACSNCINTLPHVTRLYDSYKGRGLVVIGVHTPEFPFEKSTGNVQAAIQRHGIRYPVAQDNDFATWRAYGNRFWPAQYIVDRNGKIAFTHAGEGQYDVIDRKIRDLLEAKS